MWETRRSKFQFFHLECLIAIRCYTEMLRTLLLGLAATASAQTLDDLYTITPVGKILSHCVHEVNEGAHSVEQVSGGLDGGTT
jgi:hypothetical protein